MSICHKSTPIYVLVLYLLVLGPVLLGKGAFELRRVLLQPLVLPLQLLELLAVVEWRVHPGHNHGGHNSNGVGVSGLLVRLGSLLCRRITLALTIALLLVILRAFGLLALRVNMNIKR